VLFAPGAKVTLIVQLLPATTLLPHVLVCTNWPVVLMLWMAKAPLPVLDRVTSCGALKVFTFWLPNAKLVLDKLTTGPKPVPDSEMT
jgi:hypothetical protein